MTDVQAPPTVELRADAVHDRLREAILLGELDTGAPISQVKLALRLGVSRTPLREAVRMLQREGLILSEPNRRIRVAPLSAEDLEELYAQRIVLDALALRRSVPRFEQVELDELRDLLDRMHAVERARLPEEWEGPHRRFHGVLRCHAGARIAASAAVLSDHSERYRREYLRERGAWRTAVAEHEEILAACVARDADRAVDVLVRHLARTALTLAATIAPEHDPAAVREALALVLSERPGR